MNAKTLLLFLAFLFTSLSAYAVLELINFAQIPGSEKYSEDFAYLKDNLEFYESFIPQWEAENSKDYYIKKLNKIYKNLSKLDQENYECNLVLGDISYYLYNLDADNALKKVEKHFKKAIQLDPKDYRAPWFLGLFYASKADNTNSVKYYYMAEKVLPIVPSGYFWQDYAFAMNMASMPSHCLDALDKAKAQLGEACYFETAFKETIVKRFLPSCKDSTYTLQDLWAVDQNDSLHFTCRALGISFVIDSTWSFQPYEYQGYSSAIITTPTPLSIMGKDITSTFALMITVAHDGITMDDCLKPYAKLLTSATKSIVNSPIYGDMIKYDATNPDRYPAAGGGHLNIIAFKRECPKMPGFKLEYPVQVNRSGDSGVAFYHPNSFQDRFKEDLYYVFLLDTCGNAYPQSSKQFEKFINEQIVIE